MSNVYFLSGGGIRVLYSSVGTPTLDYAGPEGVRSFTGVDIEHTFVAGGTFVSVEMPQGASLGVFLPNAESAEGAVALSTTGVRIGTSTYHPLSLTGTARTVAA